MITSEVKYIASLLVDQAKVQIPYDTASTREKNIQLRSSTSTMTISQLKNGKFRRLFNRHHRALI